MRENAISLLKRSRTFYVISSIFRALSSRTLTFTGTMFLLILLLATEKFDFLKEPPSKRLCGGCGCPINDRFLLKALDRYWHEDCLKCGCCECRLGEVGSTLYTKANLILCRRDYLR